MGLDAVELIMAVEEAFDIEIPDWEGRNLSTAGQMYAYVVSRLAFPQRERCISSAVFYRIRRALMELYGVERRASLLRPAWIPCCHRGGEGRTGRA